MIKVGIIVNERCQASSVYSAVDLILAANFALNHYFNDDKPLFSHQLIGLKSKAQAYNGHFISGLVKIQECERPDLAILPGAFESVLEAAHAKKLLDRMQPIFKALSTWHTAGTTIASVCTGNFLLASSQVAKGRALTCHWTSEDTAHQLFPKDTFDTQKLLIDHGDIVSAGGAMAVSQMLLYLISRFHSRELALATGKLMLVELNLEHQSRFAIFKPDTKHGDPLVIKLQTHIEALYQSEPNLPAFAENAGIGLKQLSRRFKKSTGETPLSYLQKYRVEQVKIGLESRAKPINNLIWDAGYEDPSSFRRLFKRHTGLTLQEYRNRFSANADFRIYDKLP